MIKLYINWFRAVLGWEELKAFGLLMKSGNIELISSMIGCSINGRWTWEDRAQLTGTFSAHEQDMAGKGSVKRQANGCELLNKAVVFSESSWIRPYGGEILALILWRATGWPEEFWVGHWPMKAWNLCVYGELVDYSRRACLARWQIESGRPL